MIGNRLIEAQAGEPAVGEVQTDFVEQPSFARDAVQIFDQQDAQQDFGIS